MAESENERHQQDKKEKVLHIPEGGGCLTGHNGKTPQKGEGDQCSYRWQAYVKMKQDPSLYNWPAYKNTRQFLHTRSFGTGKDVYPQNYSTRLNAPSKGDWDVKGDNFWVNWTKPYWHQAHHIIPKGTLYNEIAAVADAGNAGLDFTIRRGLAKEQYNINHKINMIMLPMDESVSRVLGLPIHTSEGKPDDTSYEKWRSGKHQDYSDKIASELRKIFNKLKQQLRNHESRRYDAVKAQLESLSRKMYIKIKATAAISVHEMLPSEFPSNPAP